MYTIYDQKREKFSKEFKNVITFCHKSRMFIIWYETLLKKAKGNYAVFSSCTAKLEDLLAFLLWC